MAVSLDRGTNLGGQALFCIRFEENQINSGNYCLYLDIFVGVPRDQNNRSSHVPAPQAACDSYAGHVGHLEIENEAIEVLSGCGVQHRSAASEGPDIESLRFKKESKRTEDVKVVIDHANPGFWNR